MNWLGYILTVLAAYGMWKAASLDTAKKRWAGYVACLVCCSLGIHLTRMTPYIAVAGIVLFVIAFLSGVSSEAGAKLWRTGILVLLSAVVVLGVGEFKTPWSGDIENEDRSDWEPSPDVEFTDEELLARPWSTYDVHADWPAAKLMLELCAIAYKEPAEAREELRKHGYESETISSGSMNGYVIKSGDNAVILLRGTQSSLFDVLQDLLFIKSAGENGGMHGGFRSGYSKSMHEQVNTLLERFGAKRVWITGHSLGGALSVVCAHDLIVDGKYPIAGVMTFGQPMVVRQDMSEFLEPQLDGKYVFFVNDMDPVTRAVAPYVHFGHMVRFSEGAIERSGARQVLYGGQEGDELREANDTSSQPTIEPMSETDMNELIDRLQGTQAPVLGPDGQPVMQAFFPQVSDHYLANYREMIDVLVGGNQSPGNIRTE